MTDERISPETQAEARPPASQGPFLIIGLGNPGREYRYSRHNIGFMALDHLAGRLNVRFTRMQEKALVTDARHIGRKLILAKPQTYMNLSGQAVASLARFYKVDLDNLLVVSDDIDLPTGSVRLRPGGGYGGQRGLESVIEKLGTDQFPRLRLGVGRPPGRMKAADYVLQEFKRSELDILRLVLEDASDAILAYTTEGIQLAMTRFNRRYEDS
ncbi:MAG: aminoacyl-tRNA hydrolase [Anaerolineales bacterium]|nr:aminoacyl-tRNA hydrolase [Anaerolineales bacterium]